MANAPQGMDVSKMASEGFSQMMNSMDFFKRAWSNLATPFTPTMDVEELNKRITDLKAVEQWLLLNQNVLRSTIQGLEIQRGTLDAFNSVTATFGNAMKPSDDSVAQTLARHAAAAAQKAVEPPAPASAGSKAGGLFGPFDWSPFGMPSSLLPGFHTAASSRIGSGAEDGSASPASGGAGDEAETDAGGGAQAGEVAQAAESATADKGAAPGPGEEKDAPGAKAGGGGAASGGPIPGINPLAWWEMLQENFRQIAQAATSDGSLPSSAGTAGSTSQGAGADTTRGRKTRAAGSTPRGKGAKDSTGASSKTTAVKRKRSKP